jgi:hypothetical protein
MHLKDRCCESAHKVFICRTLCPFLRSLHVLLTTASTAYSKAEYQPTVCRCCCALLQACLTPLAASPARLSSAWLWMRASAGTTTGPPIPSAVAVLAWARALGTAPHASWTQREPRLMSAHRTRRRSVPYHTSATPPMAACVMPHVAACLKAAYVPSHLALCRSRCRSQVKAGVGGMSRLWAHGL